MKTAVIALTKNGVKISEIIAEKVECDRYAFEKYAVEKTVPFSCLSTLVAEIFGKYEELVFICAVGIAVRAVAPCIRSKFTDPAVAVVDESAKFAVSLLSGHIGGANALAERMADVTGAVSVITTATDVGGRFSPDSFAKANGLHILERSLLKAVSAAVVNGGEVGFYSDYPYKGFSVGLTNKAGVGVCVTDDPDKSPFETTLHLIPKNVVLGLGCRKSTDPAAFEKFVLAAVEEAGIPLYRLAGAATINRKKDEPAILDFCKKYALPLKFYTVDELAAASGKFSSSDFVFKAVGVDNVCERCAAICGGKIIVPKRAGNGCTVAAAEMEITLDFGRKIL